MFEALDLSVLLGPDQQFWVSASSRSGAVHAVPRGGSGLATVGELQDLAEDFLYGIETGAAQPAADFGTALRDIVFGESEILALLHHTRGVAADQNRQLLIRLLAAPRALAAVPWELMLDPDGGAHQFLTLAPAAHLVRAARSRTYPVRTDPVAPPLNLLVILSSPAVSPMADDSLTFDIFEEKRNLLEELGTLEQQGLLSIDVEEHPTLENLRRRIGGRRDGYHLIHYLGHAGPTGLLLEDRFSRSALTEPRLISELLRNCPNLRLVMFAGCETARAPDDQAPQNPTPDWRTVLSIADSCVRDCCPVVIGMQAVLPMRTEFLFTRFFYQAVTTGYSLVEAVRLARSAVRGDDYVGGLRLDWAVPSVIVGGGEPGQLVDGTPATRPATVPNRAELKLDIVERDRDFFSRVVPLRATVDTLTGTNTDRVLVITGPAAVGKSRLIDRALDDIGNGVDFVLYAGSHRLEVQDPVSVVCQWVAELLTRRDGKERVPAPLWSSGDWWDRLLQELVAARFVIVIDDIEHLSENPHLAENLSKLANRRTRCRLVLVGAELPHWLLTDDAHLRVAQIRLTPFTWDEIWRWIRRNHPVLTRFGTGGLAAYYPRLGSHLELWSELAAAVSKASAELDLTQLIDQIAPQTSRPEVSPQAAPTTTPRGQRPLRVAIAGPFFEDPEGFSVVLTRLAAHYHVGGRALVPGDDASSTLALLLPCESPFRGVDSASEEDVVAWLQDVQSRQPDIVVLDYGGELEAPAQRSVISAFSTSALFIAAAGNSAGQLSYPARYDEVISVGALASPNELSTYTACESRRNKPDIFAPESLATSPLEGWLKEADHKGTSAAAYWMTAAALLVWATMPEREPSWVKSTLLDTAERLDLRRFKRFRPRSLNIPAALDRARDDLVLANVLSGRRVSLTEVLASVGLPGFVTDAALGRLVAGQKIKQTISETGEYYQLV